MQKQFVDIAVDFVAMLAAYQKETIVVLGERRDIGKPGKGKDKYKKKEKRRAQEMERGRRERFCCEFYEFAHTYVSLSECHATAENICAKSLCWKYISSFRQIKMGNKRKSKIIYREIEQSFDHKQEFPIDDHNQEFPINIISDGWIN